MKIYFEDGQLRNTLVLPVRPDFIVDARYGITANFNILDIAKDHNMSCVIYTNSIVALDNRYAWNDELKVPEIYIRSGEHLEFKRIDSLTERELRNGHNIAKLYINGEFGN